MAGVDIKGTRFEYSELGLGESLVFVHGSASDYRTWNLQQPEFAKYYRALTYSRRYHWPNDPIHLFHYIIKDLARLMPNSEVIGIQGASHLMHEDNAHAYNSAVLSFLAKSRAC